MSGDDCQGGRRHAFQPARLAKWRDERHGAFAVARRKVQRVLQKSGRQAKRLLPLAISCDVLVLTVEINRVSRIVSIRSAPLLGIPRSSGQTAPGRKTRWSDRMNKSKAERLDTIEIDVQVVSSCLGRRQGKHVEQLPPAKDRLVGLEEPTTRSADDANFATPPREPIRRHCRPGARGDTPPAT